MTYETSNEELWLKTRCSFQSTRSLSMPSVWSSQLLPEVDPRIPTVFKHRLGEYERYTPKVQLPDWRTNRVQRGATPLEQDLALEERAATQRQRANPGEQVTSESVRGRGCSPEHFPLARLPRLAACIRRCFSCVSPYVRPLVRLFVQTPTSALSSSLVLSLSISLSLSLRCAQLCSATLARLCSSLVLHLQPQLSSRLAFPLLQARHPLQI